MGRESFFGGNLVGQENWARRGEDEARIRALETRLTTAETTLALVQTGAWTDFTPTLTQGVALTKTLVYSKYLRVGRTISVALFLSITSAGTAGQKITVGLPVAALSASGVVGSWRYLDSGTTIYDGTVLGATTTTVELSVNQNADHLGALPAVTAANGDTLQMATIYEAAS